MNAPLFTENAAGRQQLCADPPDRALVPGRTQPFEVLCTCDGAGGDKRREAHLDIAGPYASTYRALAPSLRLHSFISVVAVPVRWRPHLVGHARKRWGGPRLVSIFHNSHAPPSSDRRARGDCARPNHGAPLWRCCHGNAGSRGPLCAVLTGEGPDAAATRGRRLCGPVGQYRTCTALRYCLSMRLHPCWLALAQRGAMEASASKCTCVMSRILLIPQKGATYPGTAVTGPP